jgi:hypothetical protein
MRLKVIGLGLAGLMLVMITAWAAVQKRSKFIETRQAGEDVTGPDGSESAGMDRATQGGMSGEPEAAKAVKEVENAEPVTTETPSAVKDEENLPPATVLSDTTVTPEGEKIKVIFTGDGAFQPDVFMVGEDRLVVDLEGVTNSVMPNMIPVKHGLVKRMRIGQHVKPKKARVVLDLSAPITYTFHAEGRKTVLSVEPFRKPSVESQTAAINAAVEEPVSKPVPAEPAVSTSKEPAIAEPGKEQTGRRISLDFQEADLPNVLRYLADESGMDLVIGSGVKGKVTIKLLNVPVDQALDIILKMNHLEKVREGNILQIYAVVKQSEVLKWGRDPFALPVEEKGGGSGIIFGRDLRLSAIINGPGRGVAIINNRILREGDTIEGVQVVKILNDRVMLNDESGYRELRINRLKPSP